MRLEGIVKKGWGSELIFATTEQYCGKLLNFEEGKQFSMHFHKDKDETWYVLSGKFLIEYIDTNNATMCDAYLNVGDTWHNPPLLPHRITCMDAGTIIEVSTADSVEDNYRVLPGDSQR